MGAVDHVIVAAMYNLDMLDEDGDPVPVCLGVRIGPPTQIIRYKRLLIEQLRKRYRVFFDGVTPKEIEKQLDFQIFKTEGDKRGFPEWSRYNGEPDAWLPIQ